MIDYKFTQDDYRQIVGEFFFLYPRNVWTGEHVKDYDYSWCLGVDELPKGWMVLFLLYCKNLKVELEKYDFVDNFVFSQVKEKYGSMRLYNFGYPKDSRVRELTHIYEHLSRYVCEDCGDVSKYETQGWVTMLCEKCYKNSHLQLYAANKNENLIGRKSFKVKLVGYNNEGDYKVEYDCRPYWEEYLKCKNMSKEEFIEYLIYGDLMGGQDE